MHRKAHVVLFVSYIFRAKLGLGRSKYAIPNEAEAYARPEGAHY